MGRGANEENGPGEDDDDDDDDDAMSPRLDDLPTSLLCLVLDRFEAPELLRLACTCRKFHAIATDFGKTGQYWRRLYKRQYGLYYEYTCITNGEQLTSGGWKELYKKAFLATRREMQRKRQKRVTIIENDIRDVNREIRTLKEEANDLINQERSHSKLCLEIGRGRSAEVALKTWSPVSVSVWHKQVVEQAPCDPDTRMEDLQAKVKVTQLLLRKVLQRLETKKRKLSDLEESLQSAKS